jgi:hypothetical protein
MLFLLLALFFAGFGVTLTAESDPPRELMTTAAVPNELAPAPELSPKQSTRNATDG